MAIAIDKSTLGNNFPGGSATTVTLTTTQAVVAGGFVVISVGNWADTSVLSSVANTGTPLTWAVDRVSSFSTSFPTVGIASAQAPSGLASGVVITATYSGSTPGRSIAGLSFTGVATTSPVDVVSSTTGGGATTAWSTTSLSLQAGSVLVGASWIEAVTTSTITAPSSETHDFSGTDSHTVGYRIESSAGSYAVAGAWVATADHADVGVAYKADVAVPPNIADGFAAPAGMFSPTLVEKGWFY